MFEYSNGKMNTVIYIECFQQQQQQQNCKVHQQINTQTKTSKI